MRPLVQMSFDDIYGASGSQRWRNRRERFVPPSTRFNPSRCEVVLLPEQEAKQFICTHHYSRSFVAARCRIGLMAKRPFEQSFLAGVCVYSVSMNSNVIPKYLGCAPNEGVELGRLVILDDEGDGLTGFNAETWFISRAHRLLREELPHLKGVVSFADPVPRYAEDGTLVKPGHCGVIYRASNFQFSGRTGSKTLCLGRDGRAMSPRSLSKLRNMETGADYVYRQMLEMGAPPRHEQEDPRDYLERALRSFRKIHHPGNLAFCWNFRAR